jgi:hypothetical protein
MLASTFEKHGGVCLAKHQAIGFKAQGLPLLLLHLG